MLSFASARACPRPRCGNLSPVNPLIWRHFQHPHRTLTTDHGQDAGVWSKPDHPQSTAPFGPVTYGKRVSWSPAMRVSALIDNFGSSDSATVSVDRVVVTASSPGPGLTVVVSVRTGMASPATSARSSLPNASIAALGSLGSSAADGPLSRPPITQPPRLRSHAGLHVSAAPTAPDRSHKAQSRHRKGHIDAVFPVHERTVGCHGQTPG
jgi:hypothetical protein